LLANFSAVDPNQPKRPSKFPSIRCCHVDQSSLFGNHSLVLDSQKLAEKYNVPFSSIKLESIFQGATSTLKRTGNL
jgi:hypothetical protein